MHFQVKRTFAVPADRYFAIWLSDDFTAWVRKRLERISFEIVPGKASATPGEIQRTVVWSFELPGPLSTLLRSTKLVLEEDQRLVPADGTFAVVYRTAIGLGKLQASGRGRTVAGGSGTDWSFEGDVTVRVPLVGGRIERQIIGWIEGLTVQIGRSIEAYHRERG